MKGPFKALVTGGAGFIGSHVAQALLRRGNCVTIVDNLDDFYPRSLKHSNLEEIAEAGKIRLHEVDLRDRRGLEDVFEREKPEVVIHLGARAGVRPSIEQPKLYEEVNVGGTLNLLMLSRTFEVRKFIFGSSSSVYGASSPVPFAEDRMDLKPVSPYAATKLAGEMLCYTYSHLYGLPVTTLRFFTVYGPRQRPDLAIHKFTSLIQSGKPVSVFGDGTAARDYTYVDDIVAGVLASINYETRYDVINLGNSEPVTLLDLIYLLENVIGRRAMIRFVPPQPGDVPRTWADIRKARDLLGYEPKTSIAFGLEKSWQWYRRTFLDYPASVYAPGFPSKASAAA